MATRHDHEPRRLTAEQFRQGMEGVGLRADGLAYLLGNRADRVRKWARGEEDIPLWMDAYLALLTLPGARELVLRVVRRQSQQDDGELDQLWQGRV